MTLSSKNEVLDALDRFGRMSVQGSESARRDLKPLEKLRRAVWELFELACRSPGGAAYLFGVSDRVEDESEGPGPFETLSGHVRAAQSAGELRAGDVSLMTTLIACTLISAADLAQCPRATPGAGARDAEIPLLLLLDLLATRGCDREERAPWLVHAEGVAEGENAQQG